MWDFWEFLREFFFSWKGGWADRPVIDFCVVYGCFCVYSWDLCGYFFECAFVVRGPCRGRGVTTRVPG